MKVAVAPLIAAARHGLPVFVSALQACFPSELAAVGVIHLFPKDNMAQVRWPTPDGTRISLADLSCVALLGNATIAVNQSHPAQG